MRTSRYGARCVYEEVKAAVEKKWDVLEGTEGVAGMGWCPHPDPDCVADDDKTYHYLKWAEYVVKKPVSKGKDFEEPWMTNIKGMKFLHTVDHERGEKNLADFWKRKESQIGHLTMAEVAAVRVSVYRVCS